MFLVLNPKWSWLFYSFTPPPSLPEVSRLISWVAIQHQDQESASEIFIALLCVNIHFENNKECFWFQL